MNPRMSDIMSKKLFFSVMVAYFTRLFLFLHNNKQILSIISSISKSKLRPERSSGVTPD